jgi:uncharacterized membrane protein
MSDFHPILVHFPIALLTLYAVLECVRFKRAMEVMHAFHVKATLVIFGALGAAAAYATGPDVHGSPLVAVHERFATITLIIFSVIALSYLFELFKSNKYSAFVHRSYIIIPLAVLGLIAVTITGGLGGAIVYGTQFDPFMAPIFKLLGVY